MLAAENYPAHGTLSDFRALHLQELSALFVQVVRLARECGLVKLGTVAVDGTKLKANASRHKAMSYERMLKAEDELKAQINGLLNRAKATDDLEKNDPAFSSLLLRSGNAYSFNGDGYDPYFSANLSITKEIGDHVSVSFYANNFTNSRPFVASYATGVKAVFTPDFYYGLTVRLKF